MNGILKFARVSVCLISIGISVCTLRASGQTSPGKVQTGDSKDQAHLAVNIVRVINTAEVGDCPKFLSWEDLVNSPCLKQAQSRFSRSSASHVNEISFSKGPEIVPGLELRLVVSSDGRHYNLWLGQKREVECGFAFYSDERGLIYEGNAIGCNPPSTLGKP